MTSSSSSSAMRARVMAGGSFFTMAGLCFTMLFARQRGDPAAAAADSSAPQQQQVLVPAGAPPSYAAVSLAGLEPSTGVKVIDERVFPQMLGLATASERGRKMFDLTRDPPNNDLQSLINTCVVVS